MRRRLLVPRRCCAPCVHLVVRRASCIVRRRHRDAMGAWAVAACRGPAGRAGPPSRCRTASGSMLWAPAAPACAMLDAHDFRLGCPKSAAPRSRSSAGNRPAPAPTAVGAGSRPRPLRRPTRARPRGRARARRRAPRPRTPRPPASRRRPAGPGRSSPAPTPTPDHRPVGWGRMRPAGRGWPGAGPPSAPPTPATGPNAHPPSGGRRRPRPAPPTRPGRARRVRPRCGRAGCWS
jgi:hypothetical protein